MLGIGWRYDDIWDTADQRCRITRVHGQLAFGQPKVLRSGDGAQFSQNRGDAHQLAEFVGEMRLVGVPCLAATVAQSARAWPSRS